MLHGMINEQGLCLDVRDDMGLDARKLVFGGLLTTKALISLCGCAGWPAPLLFAFWKVPYLSLPQANFRFSR